MSLFVLAMGFFAVATPAEAGGNAKKFQTVRVTGAQGAGKPANIVIFVAEAERLKADQSDAYYLSKGGAFVPNGVTRTFVVAVGAGTVWVVPNTAQTWIFGPEQNKPYVVKNGVTSRYSVELIGGDVNNPTIKSKK
ncbi:MAG: hypothetical protein HQ464_03525 [Planctomycetes bacterium]|nr:hypothetical protein [Planctomycetota bacterium]